MKGPQFPCPVCGDTLNVRPFLNAKRPGFVLECWGSDSLPHTIKMYLSDFRGDAPFLAGSFPAAVQTPGRKARASALLERAGKALREGSEA